MSTVFSWPPSPCVAALASMPRCTLVFPKAFACIHGAAKPQACRSCCGQPNDAGPDVVSPLQWAFFPPFWPFLAMRREDFNPSCPHSWNRIPRVFNTGLVNTRWVQTAALWRIRLMFKIYSTKYHFFLLSSTTEAFEITIFSILTLIFFYQAQH